MTQDNRKDIVRSQFNRQANNFSRWSVTKNLEYAKAYFDIQIRLSSLLRLRYHIQGDDTMLQAAWKDFSSGYCGL
jgi:hypothetical protein